MNLLKTVASRIIGGATVLAVLAGGVAWWQADPASRQAAASVAGRLIGWGMLVATAPWLMFGLIGFVTRKSSNAAGAILVIGLTLLEAGVLYWIRPAGGFGPTLWTLFAAAIAVAGVYNLLTCDWIAERSEL